MSRICLESYRKFRLCIPIHQRQPWGCSREIVSWQWIVRRLLTLRSLNINSSRIWPAIRLRFSSTVKEYNSAKNASLQTKRLLPGLNRRQRKRNNRYWQNRQSHPSVTHWTASKCFEITRPPDVLVFKTLNPLYQADEHQHDDRAHRGGDDQV